MPEDIHWQKYASRFKTFPARLEHRAASSGIIVCIPVFAEPYLLQTLDSLWACDLPEIPVEVILLFNGEEQMEEEELKVHKDGWQECLHWISEHQKAGLTFSPVYVPTLPDPKGGVGWARKLVLDEAARRLDQSGVMLCLDGDCTVAKNYIQAVYTCFKDHPTCDAASIYFKHEMDIKDSRAMKAIAQYELHLRYLVSAQRWAGHPFAFHTVGSSMAVRRAAYLAQGGMNTRQAGEDFYFLQKFIEIGSLHEIKSTTVYPSSRVSARVPFGTGRAMQTLLSSPGEWRTTDFNVFRLIKPLLSGVDTIRKLSGEAGPEDKNALLFEALGLHAWVIEFLNHIGFSEQCRQIASQTTTVVAFRKRFFRYFNSFMMIRYMHYISEHFIPETLISISALDLLNEMEGVNDRVVEATQLLDYYRHLDKVNSSM